MMMMVIVIMMTNHSHQLITKMVGHQEAENRDCRDDLFSDWTTGYIRPVEKLWWRADGQFEIPKSLWKPQKRVHCRNIEQIQEKKCSWSCHAAFARQLDAVEIVLKPLITQYPGRALWKISVLTKFALRNESAIGAKPSSVSHHSTHNVILIFIFTIKIIVITSKIRFSIRRGVRNQSYGNLVLLHQIWEETEGIAWQPLSRCWWRTLHHQYTILEV